NSSDSNNDKPLGGVNTALVHFLLQYLQLHFATNPPSFTLEWLPVDTGNAVFEPELPSIQCLPMTFMLTSAFEASVKCKQPGTSGATVFHRIRGQGWIRRWTPRSYDSQATEKDSLSF